MTEGNLSSERGERPIDSDEKRRRKKDDSDRYAEGGESRKTGRLFRNQLITPGRASKGKKTLRTKRRNPRNAKSGNQAEISYKTGGSDKKKHETGSITAFRSSKPEKKRGGGGESR